MNLNEFIADIEALKTNLLNEGLEINAKLSLDALALVKNRIINQGIGSRKYSTNPLPSFYFTGKGLGTGADAKAKSIQKKNAKQGINGISYVQWREANGLQTAFVDLKFSGSMWSDMAVLESNRKGFIVASVVGSKGSITYAGGQKTSDVVEYLGDKYGDFLQTTKEEEAILLRTLDLEFQELINKYIR